MSHALVQYSFISFSAASPEQGQALLPELSAVVASVVALTPDLLVAAVAALPVAGADDFVVAVSVLDPLAGDSAVASLLVLPLVRPVVREHPCDETAPDGSASPRDVRR